MNRLTKYEEEHEGFYPVAFDCYEEWSEFLDSIDVVDYVNIATCIDELGEYEDEKEKQLKHVVPKIHVEKNHERSYSCPDCWSNLQPSQKYCHNCGKRMAWGKVRRNDSN